jgi:Kef-type K+ transport system membrane component KefB
MRRLVALLLLLGTAVLVTRYGGSGSDPRSIGFAFGFALIAAALAGDLFERIRLPRITGYLVFGVVCGPFVANIISRPMARELTIVNGLAIALIAFMAGLELNFQRLLPRLRAMIAIGAIQLGVMYTALFALGWLVWPWLPILPEATGLARVTLAALLATLVVSFSPTVTIAVIADSRARGPLSELVLALVVISDLALIVMFTLAMQAVRWTLGAISAEEDVSLLARLAWEIFGSFAFGAIVGSLFAFYLRLVGREVTLMLLALCVVLSQVGAAFHFEPLLAALAAGLVVENIAPPNGDALKNAVERGALPVLVVFFAAAGASLHLDALSSIGLIAVAVSAVRFVFVRAAGYLAAGVQVPGVAPEVAQMSWMGLVSQAGVTLGLTIIVASEFPEWGARVQTLMVSLIALHELIGPVLFRLALARAGEIGKMEDDVETAPEGLELPGAAINPTR